MTGIGEYDSNLFPLRTCQEGLDGVSLPMQAPEEGFPRPETMSQSVYPVPGPMTASGGCINVSRLE